MPTTTELIALNTNQWGLILLFDGIATGFCDQAWLVGLSTGASHNVILGLQRDGLSASLAINLRDGQWQDSIAKVTIADLTSAGSLADLFGAVSDDERSLGDVPFGEGLAVHPSTDLTSRPDLDNVNIGLERIGANGARHQYPVPPSFTIGMEHSITVPGLDIEGAPVTASPIVWEGRRAALYMCFRDHVTYPDRPGVTASARPFSEARRIWCGTVRGEGTVSGREWTFTLDGPDSLLRKPLGVGYTADPVRAIGEITLVTSGEAREDGMLVRLDTGTDEYARREWSAYISASTTDEIRDDVIAEIATAGITAGVDGTWLNEDGFSLRMLQDGSIQISVAVGTIGPSRMALGLHRKVWTALGYDVEIQRALYPDESDPRAVSFTPLDPAYYETPGPDYWLADIHVGENGWVNGDDNAGNTRVYRPLYLGGTTALLAGLNEGRGQIIRLADAALAGGASQSTVAHPGQIARPITSDPDTPTSPIQIDGTNCTRCGWWLFSGKRRYAGTEQVYDERWVGFANWVGGSAQQDGLVSGDTIIVTRWEDPKMFGYDTVGGIDSDWIARDDAESNGGRIDAVPLLVLGYQHEADAAHVALQRLLYTTGTSTGWDSYSNDDPAQDAGDNEPSGGHSVRRDGEVSYLGLGISEDWVALPAMFAAEAARVENDAILDVKVAFTAGYQAEDAIRSLMQPVGWAWHFRDGALGIWCPSDALTLGDATVALDQSVRVERHSGAGTTRLRQAHRKWLPVDKWKIAADWQPLERRAANPIERIAPDPQLRYRPGEAVISILAHGMRRGGAGLAERLLLMSKWYARRHFEVSRYPVPPVQTGLSLWPGTIVNITDPELYDPSTGYGVTSRIAIVTATHREFGEASATMEVDLLVLADRTSQPRLHGLIAQGWGYNSATGRLYVKDNWAGVEGDGTWADATHFVEPTYVGFTALGGSAVVECWQWNGDVWDRTFTGSVSSVDTTPGAAYLVVGSTSGTYYRDMDTWVVLRDSTNSNGAWVEAWFAAISNDAGTWVDDAAATQDYRPWET